jgi:hypothetical protein
MRFFTDQYFSEAQKSKLLENSHLIERLSIKLDDQETQLQRPEPVFYMEWQQAHSEPATIKDDDCLTAPPPVTDLSAVLVSMMVGGIGVMFVFDVLLN